MFFSKRKQERTYQTVLETAQRETVKAFYATNVAIGVAIKDGDLQKADELQKKANELITWFANSYKLI